MPTERIAAVARRRGPAAAILFVSFLLLLLAAGCTRDEVGAAIATLAVEMQATLEPWSATAEANVAALAAGATDRAGSAPTTSPLITPATLPATAPPTTGDASPDADAPPTAVFTFDTPTVAPAATTAPQQSPTALPTPTPAATATPEPTSTPQPSPTSLPPVITVPGGSMTLVAGGFFQMGAAADALLATCETFSADCRRDWFTSAEPVHTVLVAPFYLDTYEVTNAAYVEFLNAIGGEVAVCQGQACLDPDQSRIGWDNGTATVAVDRAQSPATGATWYGAAAFCAWRDARLPTEAEWEKAAAWDDAAAAAHRFPWGDDFHGQRLNFCDATCAAEHANVAWNDGYAVAAPVGNYEDGRGPSGHYDLAGNVWEWVADWYDPAYYATSPDADPTGPETGEQKVVRGGSWYDTATFTLSAVRLSSPPTNADATLGFRCAADLP